MPIFVIEIVFEIVIEIGKPCSTLQKIVIEIVIEICMEQTRLFQCNRFHFAENRQSGPSRFFREVGGAYEYLCRARAGHDVIGHNKRSMSSSCIHIFVIVIYVH